MIIEHNFSLSQTLNLTPRFNLKDEIYQKQFNNLEITNSVGIFMEEFIIFLNRSHERLVSSYK